MDLPATSLICIHVMEYLKLYLRIKDIVTTHAGLGNRSWCFFINSRTDIVDSGQAWAMLGFVQTYQWTREPGFLETATSLADLFSTRLSRMSCEFPFVPPWDFDAPFEPDAPVLRDASAGMIAANALLLLHQALQANSPYLDLMYRILQDTLSYCLSKDPAKFQMDDTGQITVTDVSWDSILMHSTVNNNEYALERYADLGLIYADYYFLELGNKLLRMGLM